ncbi:hypothetical protein BOX15_Mlig020281g1, partial [Macrostomum lignano]
SSQLSVITMAKAIAWKSVDDLFFSPVVYRLLRSMAISQPADRRAMLKSATAASTEATAAAAGQLLPGAAAGAQIDGGADGSSASPFGGASTSDSSSAPLERICLLNEAQLQEHMRKAAILEQQAMQMPPYLQAWKEKSDTRVLQDDSDRLANCLPPGQKIVVVDIGIKDKVAPQDRFMAIRESNGQLRSPMRSERRDLLQTYFPLPHRRTVVPSMFAVPKNLERLLSPELHKYAYVLDRATVQFEPNDPQYVRIRDRVYEAVDEAKAYAELQATRHFGGLVLHLVLKQKTAGLIVFLLQTEQFERCLHLLRLRTAIHDSDAKALQNYDLPFVLNDAKSFDNQRKIGLLVCLMKLEPTVSRVAKPLLERFRQASVVGRHRSDSQS